MLPLQAGAHGGTALGWMVVRGEREQGTDQHSRTAAAAGVTRDQAKVTLEGLLVTQTYKDPTESVREVVGAKL